MLPLWNYSLSLQCEVTACWHQPLLIQMSAQVTSSIPGKELVLYLVYLWLRGRDPNRFLQFSHQVSSSNCEFSTRLQLRELCGIQNCGHITLWLYKYSDVWFLCDCWIKKEVKLQLSDSDDTKSIQHYCCCAGNTVHSVIRKIHRNTTYLCVSGWILS